MTILRCGYLFKGLGEMVKSFDYTELRVQIILFRLPVDCFVFVLDLSPLSYVVHWTRGKLWAYSANTHWCVGKQKTLIFFIPMQIYQKRCHTPYCIEGSNYPYRCQASSLVLRGNTSALWNGKGQEFKSHSSNTPVIFCLHDFVIYWDPYLDYWCKFNIY